LASGYFAVGAESSFIVVPPLNNISGPRETPECGSYIMSSTQVSIFSVPFKENKLREVRKKKTDIWLGSFPCAPFGTKLVRQYIYKRKEEKYRKKKHNNEALSCNFCRSWKSITINIIWLCVRSLKCPACNVHASYFHLCPASLYNIFLYYLINAKIFEKKLLKLKCVFWFSLLLLSETFLILRRIQRDMIRYVYWSSRKVMVILFWLYSCVTILEKYSDIKFHENSSSGSRVLLCGRTDGQTWRTIFSQSSRL